jgi:phenylacetate-CoA ligase
MGVLNHKKLYGDVSFLLKKIESSQYQPKTINFNELSKLPILTRSGLRDTKMEKGVASTKTSGSTGEPLVIEKTYEDQVWFITTNILDIRWRKWDVTKNIAIINAAAKEDVFDNWSIPRNIEPIQGKMYTNGHKTLSELQSWLEEVNPHYISCYPSIIKHIDTSKISNFIDWKGTGELGGTCYSSNECGVIALQCPSNSGKYHVMDNHIVEVDTDGGMLITTLTNPYIRRYKHGDHIELGECDCGRTSQVISKIHGRVRNMFIMPNGDKKWPLIGSLEYSNFGIKQFKATQTSLNDLVLEIICDNLLEKEKKLISLIQEMLGTPINVTIKYVDSFPNYKFEEFISLV